MQDGGMTGLGIKMSDRRGLGKGEGVMKDRVGKLCWRREGRD
jgi:hypothetical protein